MNGPIICQDELCTTEVIEGVNRQQQQLINNMKEDLKSKDKELEEFRIKMQKIEVIKENRRQPVINSLKKRFLKYKQGRSCKSCKQDQVRCQQCRTYFNVFTDILVQDGFLKRMSDKLIETDDVEAKCIIMKLYAEEINYTPTNVAFSNIMYIGDVSDEETEYYY